MKRRILSILLAVAMIFGTAVPVFQCLPTAFSVDAAASVPECSKATYYVENFGALKWALKYAASDSTIVLTNDIEATNVYDASVEVGAKGKIALDLNGYEIAITNSTQPDFIKLTNETEFYLLNSASYSSVYISSDETQNTSVVSIENDMACFYAYGLLGLVLGEDSGSINNPDSAVIRVKKFREIEINGTSVVSYSSGACSVSFEPEAKDAFKNSSVTIIDANVKSKYSCVSFIENEKCDNFFSIDAFKDFTVIFGEAGSLSSEEVPLFRVPSDCTVTYEDIMPDSIELLDMADNPVSKKQSLDKIKINVQTYILSDCSYYGSHFTDNYTNILYASTLHIRKCNGCSLCKCLIHYTPSSAHKDPTITEEGRSEGVHCNFPSESDSHYDTSAPIPTLFNVPKIFDWVEVDSVEEFLEAIYSKTTDRVIRLTDDIFFFSDESNGEYPVTVHPQAAGDIIIDLNGYALSYQSCDGESDFITLDSFDTEKGATRLHITDSAPNEDSGIDFRTSGDGNAMFRLVHPACSLNIYPDVKLRVNYEASTFEPVLDSNNGSDIIRVEKFNQINIYGGEFANETMGNALNFVFKTTDDYYKSSVQINGAVFSTEGSAINFLNLPYDAFCDSFRIGYAEFYSGNTADIPRINSTNSGMTFGDIIRNGFRFEDITNESMVSPESSILSYDDSAEFKVTLERCEYHDTTEILYDDKWHYMQCQECGKLIEKTEHTRIPGVEPACDHRGAVEYDCDCGCTNLYDTDFAHELKFVKGTVTCTEDGTADHYVCEKCGKYFMSKNDDEPSDSIPLSGPMGHDSEVVTESAATCTEDGNILYYRCTREDCGRIFSNKLCKDEDELSPADVVISKNGHKLNLSSPVYVAPTCLKGEGNLLMCMNPGCSYSEIIYNSGSSSLKHLSGTSVYHPEVPATCTTDGTKAYYTCPRPGCDGKYADEALVILHRSLTIPKTNHDMSFEYIEEETCTDDGLHLWSCGNSGCSYSYYETVPATGHLWNVGEYTYRTCDPGDYQIITYTCIYDDEHTKISKDWPAVHKYDIVSVIAPPSCTGTGTRKITCSNDWCGDSYTENIESLGGHIIEEVEGIPAKCQQTGIKTHYKCTRADCGMIFQDAGGNYPIYDVSHLVIPETKCIGTRQLIAKHENSCTEDGWFSHYKCTVCGKLYGDQTSTVEFDPYKFMEAREHSLTLRTAKPASCTASGTIAYYECSGQFGCGAKFLDADGNVPVTDVTDPVKAHKLYFVEEEAPTCTKKGVKAHYRCEKLCGLYFSDNKGTVTTPDALWLDAQHTPGNWELTKAPSPSSPGVEALKCAICKVTISTRNVPYVEPEYILGDVDGDKNISAADARLALRASVKLEKLTETQTKAANVDKKDGVTAADARLILRASVKLETLG